MSEPQLEKVIANFDGIRRRDYRRLPVLRRCRGCKRLFLIAMIFGDATGRFRFQHCNPKPWSFRPMKDMEHAVIDRMRRNIVERLTWSLPEYVFARKTTLGRIAGVYFTDRAPEFAR